MKIWEIDFSKNRREYIMEGLNTSVIIYVLDNDIYYKHNNILVSKGYIPLQSLLNDFTFSPAPLDIKVGDILKTNNGDFKIVKINTPEYPETPSYGAMFLDECEIQYMSNRLERLLKDIMIDCDLIEFVEC